MSGVGTHCHWSQWGWLDLHFVDDLFLVWPLLVVLCGSFILFDALRCRRRHLDETNEMSCPGRSSLGRCQCSRYLCRFRTAVLVSVISTFQAGDCAQLWVILGYYYVEPRKHRLSDESMLVVSLLCTDPRAPKLPLWKVTASATSSISWYRRKLCPWNSIQDVISRPQSALLQLCRYSPCSYWRLD